MGDGLLCRKTTGRVFNDGDFNYLEHLGVLEKLALFKCLMAEQVIFLQGNDKVFNLLKCSVFFYKNDATWKCCSFRCGINDVVVVTFVKGTGSGFVWLMDVKKYTEQRKAKLDCPDFKNKIRNNHFLVKEMSVLVAISSAVTLLVFIYAPVFPVLNVLYQLKSGYQHTID